MIIRIKTSADIPSSEITPEQVYHSRREFMRTAAVGAAGAVAAGAGLLGGEAVLDAAQTGADLAGVKKSPFVGDRQTAHLRADHQLQQLLRVRNGEERPGAELRRSSSRARGRSRSTGWSASRPTTRSKISIKFNQLEERVYRHRCVEALVDGDSVGRHSACGHPEESGADVGGEVRRVHVRACGRRRCPVSAPGTCEYPYVEGLRMDEAMHPLTLMVVGLYGKVLPNQNGAPLRIHIPWKYGFKSGKSIVRIRLTDKQPLNTWQLTNSDEYGFYANVNPTVDHPRWSQKSSESSAC